MIDLTKTNGVIDDIIIRAISYALENNDDLDGTERTILASIVGTTDIDQTAGYDRYRSNGYDHCCQVSQPQDRSDQGTQ